jgi:alanyl-tRNA synthetase
MQSADIRTAFLRYFERNAHRILPSAPLVPQDDPTLLFVNAGMVPFKKMFLGAEEPVPGRRATTSQKCVRAGGKHNDLEQVGHTARHHTFFEMLGNFSFGDYFKRDAIRFAWEFLTVDLEMDPAHMRVTVYHGDDESPGLWQEVAGLAPSRIYRLGEKDNFWQMAETGPCGPCSEIYVDLAHVTDDWRLPAGASGEWTELDRTEFSRDEFVEGAEAGRFLEFWNLVFMQYDRQEDGTLVPLPRPSVDTGMGLERIGAVLQRRSNNFHTDLFTPLLDAVSAATGVKYDPASDDPKFASHRVLADHARAVAFLLADGVFPSNEGRGYVLRRILRRAVRHAWLLGSEKPLLFQVVKAVVARMGDAYPELRRREKHLLETTRAEEERFLATIAGGMKRFDEIAPLASTQGSSAIRGTLSGEDVFRLYDTFGFPLDLTELMARERGYTVDVAGFEQALERQRAQSREDWKSRDRGAAEEEAEVVRSGESGVSEFVGYSELSVETRILAVSQYADGRMAVALERTPFYVAGGGQIADVGEVRGDGWSLEVDDVRREDGQAFVIGKLSGNRDSLLHSADQRATVSASVPRGRRLDTERNHTATHLLHAALRDVLGEHVHQAGSLVAPDRLRFDFTHHGPVTHDQLDDIERRVNEGIFAAEQVQFEQKPYAEALELGAMALFGEKYGDVVRVVSVPGRSVELCGGTHVRNTAEIGLLRIVSETGIAAGVRRIEAITGPRAFEFLRERERELVRTAEALKSPPSAVAQRVQALLDERRAAGKKRDAADSGTAVKALLDSAVEVNGTRVVAAAVTVPDVRALQESGDALRAQLGSGVGVLAASFGEGKNTLLLVVTDDLRDRGIRADTLIRDLAALAGGRGGGKPHMAQAGIADAARIPELLAKVPEIVRPHLQG